MQEKIIDSKVYSYCGQFPPHWLQGFIGSVAQIGRDCLRDSKVLVGLHEQAHTPDLPHEELARLQCRPEAAWLAAIWDDPGTVWLAEPSARRGRPAPFTDAAIQVCLTLKALFGLPLRQTTGLVASLLELAGLDGAVPDFSTLSRRQKGRNVAIPYWPGTGALHLLIDSTGIKSEGDGEWCAKKHGPSKPRQWRKVHRGIDAKTLEIRAIEVTGAGVGDAPMLPELLEQIPKVQPIGKVSSDGACDTRACHAAIAARIRRELRNLTPYDLDLAALPGFAVIIPANDEARHIGPCLAGMFANWNRPETVQVMSFHRTGIPPMSASNPC